MVQFNIFQSFKNGEEKEITKEELQYAMDSYLKEHPHVSILSLVNDDHTIDYKLLKRYLKCKPVNTFIMAKETGEIFEDTEENREIVKWINHIQQAIDQYVYDKEVFPLKENTNNLEVCYMKLKPYLKNEPPVAMYVSEKYLTVSNQPDKK
ncbi:MAG: DUF3939 domain-containing protein [Bacillaceae bacterium]